MKIMPTFAPLPAPPLPLCLQCVPWCHQLLHSRCTELKAELRSVMLRHGIKSMRLVPVKRNYAFEDTAIPPREQWVIKVCAWCEGGGRRVLGREAWCAKRMATLAECALQTHARCGWVMLTAP